MNTSPHSSSELGLDQAVLYSVRPRIDQGSRHAPHAEDHADELKDWLDR